MVNLSDEALQVIRYGAAQGDRFKVDDTVKAKANGDHREVLDELIEEGLIEKTDAFGYFAVTDQGQKYEYEEIGCNDCGAKFYSRIQAKNAGGMRCSHDNLSLSMTGFTEDDSR